MAHAVLKSSCFLLNQICYGGGWRLLKRLTTNPVAAESHRIRRFLAALSSARRSPRYHNIHCKDILV
ncbi:hypothetical protein GE061_008970 [Apolygus lucorum]|uniref:Uncharacterized protein n=1 Tax=Apolygus lucorum TaxID=248454 RepID=A0A6A4KH08_APOLU|nr:hypothetical protein GE061_008970 [Apolygus lucorum]